MKTLVYCGLYHGQSFAPLVDQYDLCIGFEANPHLIPTIESVVGNRPNVKIFNLAVSDKNGYSSFKLSSNAGQSSSLAGFNPEFSNLFNGTLEMASQVTVQTVNIFEFLSQKMGLDGIDTYISDIQGYDLTALQSLKPWIDAKKIGTIQSEVAKDGRLLYNGPSNEFSKFQNLLGENYELTSTGWCQLVDGKFDQVPDDWWEFDARWSVRATH